MRSPTSNVWEPRTRPSPRVNEAESASLPRLRRGAKSPGGEATYEEVRALARPSPIELPRDVIDYIRGIFVTVNQTLCSRIERQPNVHEESLDLAFLDAVAAYSGPHRTESDTVVDIDLHFVGGGWHFERWEVADIGLIVNFRRLNNVLRTKIVLLQSKRLYPREADFVETHGLARPGGFGYLVRSSTVDIRSPRAFHFDPECCYRALQVGDKQWAVIAEYEGKYSIPVHYLLYHPGQMPSETVVPIQLPLSERPIPVVGTRVVPTGLVRAETTAHARNYAPSFHDLAGSSPAPGTPLPDFMIDDVLGCREGYIPEDFNRDEGVNRIFNLRSGPISAAILIDIDLPQTVQQP
jgi:hypothetical protein